MTTRTVPALPADAADLSGVRFWALFAALFLTAALPVLWVELPPLFDYPNHLARMELLLRLPASETLQRYYELRWRPVPRISVWIWWCPPWRASCLWPGRAKRSS